MTDSNTTRSPSGRCYPPSATSRSGAFFAQPIEEADGGELANRSLWANRLPLGGLSLLIGNSSWTGLLLDAIAERIDTGHTWWDGAHNQRRPLLFTTLTEDSPCGPTLQSEIATLRNAVEVCRRTGTRRPGCVIAKKADACLNGLGSHNFTAKRARLGLLAEFAAETGYCVLADLRGGDRWLPLAVHLLKSGVAASAHIFKPSGESVFAMIPFARKFGAIRFRLERDPHCRRRRILEPVFSGASSRSPS